jgi:FkbM family methyltransferase
MSIRNTTFRVILAAILNRLFFVPYFGFYFATGYFFVIGALCRNPLNSKFFGLAYLPKETAFHVKIVQERGSYLYSTSVGDALNLDCRTSFNEWEVESRKIWRNLAGTAQLIFDIGAYTGIYALEACSVNSEAKVMAFEPNPYMRTRLNVNLKVNNFHIDSLEYGLGSEISELNLYLPFGETTSIATMIPVGQSEKIRVAVKTLDSLALQDLDLMKIDCEGFELEILKGGREAINRHRPTILMEALSQGEYEAQSEFLGDLGFIDLFPEGIGQRFGDDRNHLWVHNSNLEKVRGLLLLK